MQVEKYNSIIKEFGDINDNFHYTITEEGEYVCYLMEYNDDYALEYGHTNTTIFKTKDKDKFVEILKQLDGDRQYVVDNHQEI